MRQSHTGPSDNRASADTICSICVLVFSKLTSGTERLGQDFRTRRCAPDNSHALGSHVSPAPAILQRVFRRNVCSSGCRRAMDEKEGISSSTDQTFPPEG